MFTKLRRAITTPRPAGTSLIEVLTSSECPWEPGGSGGCRRVQVDHLLAVAFNQGHSLVDLEPQLEIVIRWLGGHRDDSARLPYFVVPEAALARRA